MRTPPARNSGYFTERRHTYYASRQDTVTFLRVHPLANGPDDTFDYTDAATGMTYRNSLNTGGVRVDGIPDAVRLGQLDWEQLTGGQGTITHVHRIEMVPVRSGVTLPVLGSFYADDATPLPDFVQCTGDAKAIATSGPALLTAHPDSDPRDRGGAGHDYDLTAHRTQYYDPPNQSLTQARDRNRWARQPLEVGLTAWTGRHASRWAVSASASTTMGWFPPGSPSDGPTSRTPSEPSPVPRAAGPGAPDNVAGTWPTAIPATHATAAGGTIGRVGPWPCTVASAERQELSRSCGPSRPLSRARHGRPPRRQDARELEHHSIEARVATDPHVGEQCGLSWGWWCGRTSPEAEQELHQLPGLRPDHAVDGDAEERLQRPGGVLGGTAVDRRPPPGRRRSPR